MLARRYLSQLSKNRVKRIDSRVKVYFSEEQDQSEPFLHSLEQELKEYYGKMKKQNYLDGHATGEGTQEYFEQGREYNQNILKQHFRDTYQSPSLKVGSLGIGTYIGAPDAIDDLKMFNAIVAAVSTGGVNVVDTAINYRYMKSERTVGAALQYLTRHKDYTRQQLQICTKNGFIPEDQDLQVSGQHMVSQLVNKGLITQDDIVATVHCMHPAFLQDQLQRSLDNLQLNTIDLMFLHNSAEVQMPLIGEEKYYERLEKAFEFYEEQVQKNKIRGYGLATWSSMRAKSSEKNIYQDLQKVVKVAEKVGGMGHHLHTIQVPLNLIMHEAFSSNWQLYKQPDGMKVKERLLTVARYLKVNVITSSPLWQGAMLQVPMSTDTFMCQHLGAKHLNFIRSIPSEAIKTTLVGMKTKKHLQQNLEVLEKPMLHPEDFWEFLRPPQEESTQQQSSS